MHFSNRQWPLGAIVILLASAASPVIAADVPHPIVAGFERFYSGDKADLAAGGQLLLSELNCVSCHQSEGLSRKQAPILDAVGTRVHVGFLRKYLTDPHAVKPGAAMPDLFAGDPEKAEKIEALVQFLASTGALKQERIDTKSAAIGSTIYSKIGCFACHGARDLTAQPAKDLPSFIVPLGDLKSKYSIPSLAAFLANPLQTRPSGRMPHLLMAKDARDVANYLMQGAKVKLTAGLGSTTFAYYEGDWQKLPDLSKLKPKNSGTGAAFDLKSAKRDQNFAMKFEGFFTIDKDGDFQFKTSSDDGSRLLIDGAKIAEVDGIHTVRSASGNVKLTKGKHKVVVEYFQADGGAELSTEIEGPGIAKQNLADMVFATEAALEKKTVPKKDEDEDSIEKDPALIDKGKLLFASVGCANCHQMQADKKPIAPSLKATSLAKLKTEGGCLSGQPTKGTAFYGLSAKQKSALAAALSAPVAESKEPAVQIARAMTTLNCYACHSRDKVGGPTEELNKLFQTTQQEMGDEGRAPPSLDGVGAKLNQEYFKQMLDKGVHDRPYMQTHMPGFGSANVGQLPALFAALDKVPTVGEIKFDVPMVKVYSAARHIIGEQALSCIKCHTFNGIKAEGIQGIDMTMMPKRLNRDWFHFYVVDPQKYRPGTRMPSAFVNKVSPLPQVLDGDTDKQIEAMWVYLQQGKAAATPLGMGAKSIPLRPFKEAIIYRNFIKGAGSRAIGVGYPEKINLAFDANDMRMALIWQGAFIDAALHWEGRGQGEQSPLGDNILALPAGPPFAMLAKPDDAWPKTHSKELGFKFLGYRLTPDERPTFDYSFNDVKIEDTPNPSMVGKDASLKRTFKLTAATTVDNLYFRAAVGKKIEAAGDGWFKIDGWKMKIESTAAPKIRQSDGKSELIVPVEFKDGKATIVQEFLW